MRTKFKAWTVPYIEEHKEVMFDEEQLLNFDKPYYLEIGSGKGQFLVDMAKKFPDKFFVGIERNVTCCGFTAKKLVEEQLPNARLMFLNAEFLMDKIADNSIEAIFLNFSDPWPKKKHHKRRLTADSYLKNYYRVLKKGGRLIIKTDNVDLFTFTLENLENSDFKLVFKTDDLCCAAIAKQIGLTVETTYENCQLDNYTGFIEQTVSNEELVKFYEASFEPISNHFGLLENQYLIVKDENGKIANSFKWKNGKYEQIIFPTLKSDMFGTIKPKDEYQKLAIDSLLNNKITVLRGPAGSGKSYLSFAALFQKLEKHEIDKIIIFCNTVATANSAKLGFYPGSRNEKLLDSQIGNFLSSKLGDNVATEKFIAEGKLALLPMSDIRGYDTTGMKAGIYITEAQNLDIELMRLALQRVGEDSICILDGDDQAQVDLSIYGGVNNGLRRVSEVFRGSELYGEITLQKIHRSKIAELAQLM